MTTEPTGIEPAISPAPIPPIPKPRAASDAETIHASTDSATADAPGGPAGRAAADRAAGSRRNWPVVAGSIAVVGLGIGWFLLSLAAFHDSVTDSFTEGIGAALGLLVAISIIGAIVSARGNRNRPAGS